VTINPKTFADSGETLRQLALQGSGIACLSAFTVKQDVADGRLVPLLKDRVLNIRIPVYLVYYSDKAVSGRVRCFIDLQGQSTTGKNYCVAMKRKMVTERLKSNQSRFLTELKFDQYLSHQQ